MFRSAAPFFFFFFLCYFSFFFLSFFFRFLSASLLGREKEKESESVCEGKHETIDYHFSKVRALDLDLLGLFDSDFFSRGSARLWALVSNFFNSRLFNERERERHFTRLDPPERNEIVKKK